MESFYTPASHISSTSLIIDGDEFQHLTHVMRRQAGDAIRVVDGEGNAYEARITGILKREVRCEIVAHTSMENEPRVSLTLAAGILKNAAKFDFLVEKATELGARAIVPLSTARTIPQHAKSDRWQKLALAAMKQSSRCVLPEVRPLTALEKFLQTASPASAKFIPHEKTASPLLSEAARQAAVPSVAVCIGPEGGLTDEELALAVRHGFVPVSLGPRRLRTETAAIIAAAFALGQ